MLASCPKLFSRHKKKPPKPDWPPKHLNFGLLHGAEKAETRTSQHLHPDSSQSHLWHFLGAAPDLVGEPRWGMLALAIAKAFGLSDLQPLKKATSGHVSLKTDVSDADQH
jgi:hypothetical protein